MRTFFFISLFGLCLFFNCSSDDALVRNDTDNDPILTQIPDSAFEQALIDAGIDNTLDGSVPTSNLQNVTELVFNNKNISNMQGLEDFPALINLWLNDNALTQLNISQNRNLKFVYAENNSIAVLSTNGLDDLEKIGMNGNDLTNMNVNGNTNLQILRLADNNVQSIDVSNNSALTILDVTGNPLTCIQVNSDQLNNIPLDWQKDSDDEYSENCAS